MKKNKFQEKGQALIIIALAALVLFGFAALAIDGSRVFSDRRNAQNAADTAVLAAALAKVKEETYQGPGSYSGPDYITAAKNRATSNRYTDGVNGTVVLVQLCSQTTCTGVTANQSEYIKVSIKSVVPMTFAKVLGRTQITNNVEAIARAKIAPPISSWLNAGMVAVKSDNSDQCFKVNGSADLGIHGSGIFVNCTGSSALFLNGGADIGMDGDAQVAGCTNNTSFEIGVGEIDCSTPQQTLDASTFASYATTSPTPICTNPGSIVGNTINPGYFNSSENLSGKTFAPGTFCFPQGFKLTGGGSVSGIGMVQLVLGAAVDLKGDANSFYDLEIYADNADFTLNGTLTANSLRFFGNGSSDFNVQGGALTSDNAYIYSEGGLIDIQAQAAVNLIAPPLGDPFAGMVIHTPWSNTNPFVLNGGTDSSLTGMILVPHSDVTFNGSESFEIHGQVIGYTFQVNGSGHSDIYYQGPGDTAVDDPTIELTK